MVLPVLLIAATLWMTSLMTSSVSVLDKYDQTLDIVFHHELRDCQPFRPSVALRFLPSFQQEYQILLCHGKDGKALVAEETLPESEGTVWEQLAQSDSGAIRSAAAVASHFHVRSLPCDVDTQTFDDWMRKLYSISLAPPDDGVMINDGVGYEMTIRAGADHTFARVQGPRDHSALIEWMEMVEKAVQKSRKREMVKKK
jgi:hypothetical protein